MTRLGLEPRTLSLKVRCSNQLSYQVFSFFKGGKDSQISWRTNLCTHFVGSVLQLLPNSLSYL